MDSYVDKPTTGFTTVTRTSHQLVQSEAGNEARLPESETLPEAQSRKLLTKPRMQMTKSKDDGMPLPTKKVLTQHIRFSQSFMLNRFISHWVPNQKLKVHMTRKIIYSEKTVHR
ncbi:hypothetical protein X801_09519, partial [Opisthorchis viverrini]